MSMTPEAVTIPSDLISFPFVGGTMAGQNVTECSRCFALVLSGSINGHRLNHREEDDAVRRDGDERLGSVVHGPDHGIEATGDGADEVPDGVRASGEGSGQPGADRAPRRVVKKP